MRRFLIASGILMAFFTTSAFAAWYDPRTWIGGLLSDGVWTLAAAVLGWMFKRTLDSFKLKAAVISIKDAIDSVRMANDANSPGGNKVTIGEAVGIAEKSMTSILSVLRTLNPKWLPHWIADTDTASPALPGK